MNKLSPKCSYWQILSLVCPKKYPINLKVCAKIVGTMNKVSLRTADVFPVVAGGEATTGNTSAVRRLE